MRMKVGIVDDHPAVILGVVALLNSQTDLFVTGTGATVRELLRQTETLDVVLLDLSLSDNSTPAQNLAALNARGARVLIYSSGEQPSLVRDASRAGAMGMIYKSIPGPELIDAVRAVGRGEVVPSTEWAAALDQDTKFVKSQLSQREAEVLGFYASGETAEGVGRRLYISRETVLDHIRRIRAKYLSQERPAQTKIDLYLRAVEDGIITGPNT